MELLKKDLRALLISNKHGIPLNKLNQQFYDLTQSHIIYDRLKYDSLESFLKSIPDVVKLVGTINSLTAHGVPTEKQSNLQKLIRAQKNTNKKPLVRASIDTKHPFTRPCSGNSNNSRRRPYYLQTSSYRRDSDRKNSSNVRELKESRIFKRVRVYRKDERSSSNDSKLSSQGKLKGKKFLLNPIFQPNLDVRTTIFDMDYKSELDQFIKENDLGEAKYKTPQPTFTMKNDKQVAAYLSSLYIDSKHYITYPAYFESQLSAENAVAKRALDELKFAKSPTSSKSRKLDDKRVIRNMIKLFEEDDMNWLFDSHVENKYFETYNTKLESDWLHHIKASKVFSVEKAPVTNKEVHLIALSLDYQYHMYYYQSADDETSGSSLESGPSNGEQSILNVIRELPEQPELIGNREWNVEVLGSRNGKVWLRLCDKTADLNELIAQLLDYYVDAKKGNMAREVVCNDVYAAVIDQNVFRVQALELIGHGQVKCLFIDEGIHENVSKMDLYELIDSFVKLPTQAIESELEGFKDVDQETSQLIEKYFDFKMKEHNNSLFVIAKPISFEPTTIRLYEAASENCKINLNELLINFIENSKSKFV